jgi:hypothetical protein
MKAIEKRIKQKRYKKIKFKVLKSQHLLVKAKINGIKGLFILDTGASNSCVGNDKIDYFRLQTKASETKAAGAGAINIDTQIAKNSCVAIGKWKNKKIHLVVFDMLHVNQALEKYCKKPISGIIGADILIHGKAIIDYKNHHLFLNK